LRDFERVLAGGKGGLKCKKKMLWGKKKECNAGRPTGPRAATGAWPGAQDQTVCRPA
jgi:hypothetical protein